MIRIDDTLLQDLGLATLPKEERDKLLRQIYETLEMRVGMQLAERMSDAQLDEFERFINGDLAFTEDYLNKVKPGWTQGEAYQKATQNAQTAAQRTGAQFNENAVKTEFGALSWLETNFPDYKQVVASELEKLKTEIKADSSKIVQAMGAQQLAVGQPPMQQPQVQPQQPPVQQQPVPSVQPAPQVPPAQSQAPVQPPTDQQPPQFPPAQAA
jgi:hypothetical protein